MIINFMGLFLKMIIILLGVIFVKMIIIFFGVIYFFVENDNILGVTYFFLYLSIVRMFDTSK